jgi:hypothetical protein
VLAPRDALAKARTKAKTRSRSNAGKIPRGLIGIKDTTGGFGNTGGMPNTACSRKPSHHADDLLEKARQSFLLAGKADVTADVERYAAIGRDYLERAHAAARVDDQRQPRSL